MNIAGPVEQIEPDGCTDLTSGTTYPVDAVFERGCEVCKCASSGELVCEEKACVPPPNEGPDGWYCSRIVPQGGCCPILSCMIRK